MIIKKRLTVLLFTSFLAYSDISAARAGGPDLFSVGRIEGADIAYNQPLHVVRYRYLNVDFKSLPARADAADFSPELTLNLFPDVNYSVVVKKVQNDPALGTILTGSLEGIANSRFTLVKTDGAFIAHIVSPDGAYEVSSVGDGLYRVIEIDQSQFKDCPDGAYKNLPSGSKISLPGDLGATADTGSTIDIMVAYTAAARAAEGSAAAMKARIALAVAQTNQAYADSGVVPRLRLVHVEEVSYTETGNATTDRNRLIGTTDGYMDNIHALRTTYGADMVSLIVNNGGNLCGIAGAIMATASNAFQVTVRSCMTSNHVFGHEFAHLQGARHDIYVDSTNTPYLYGHGYVHPYTTDTTKRWRTIMAYNDRCEDWGYNCTRIPRFSNPTRTYTGDPTGAAGSSEVYKVLNNTAYTVANFRAAVIGSDFNSQFNTSSSGWSAVAGTWGLNSGAYYASSGLAGNFASTKYANTYGDFTYQARMKRTGTCTGCANRLIIRGNPSSLSVAKSWQPSYLFQYNNNGSFSVYEISATGVGTALKGWTAHAAIVKNGWNTLRVC